MTQAHSIGDPGELAALYVAGAMTPDETSQYEHHLADGCASCRDQLMALAGAGGALASATPSALPAASVRAALLKRIDDLPQSSPQVWSKWDAVPSGGLHIVRSGEGQWEDTGVPGVRVRKLFVDRDRNVFTAIVKMEPGAAWPRHRHDGPEECLVLEGDLHVGEIVLHKGDFQRADEDSHHDVEWTQGGCTLLISSSLSDEVY